MSPIRPENRHRYPADWPTITQRIKDRAGWRCECTGECGRGKAHLGADGRCTNRHGQPAYATGSIVVLTRKPSATASSPNSPPSPPGCG